MNTLQTRKQQSREENITHQRSEKVRFRVNGAKPDLLPISKTLKGLIF